MAGPARQMGYVFDELYMWHTQGYLGHPFNKIQPVSPGRCCLACCQAGLSRSEPARRFWMACLRQVPHWESPESKRRLHNLLAVSGLLEQLTLLKPRKATKQEIMRWVCSQDWCRVTQQRPADVLFQTPSSAGLHAQRALPLAAVVLTADQWLRAWLGLLAVTLPAQGARPEVCGGPGGDEQGHQQGNALRRRGDDVCAWRVRG